MWVSTLVLRKIAWQTRWKRASNAHMDGLLMMTRFRTYMITSIPVFWALSRNKFGKLASKADNKYMFWGMNINFFLNIKVEISTPQHIEKSI